MITHVWFYISHNYEGSHSKNYTNIQLSVSFAGKNITNTKPKIYRTSSEFVPNRIEQPARAFEFNECVSVFRANHLRRNVFRCSLWARRRLARGLSSTSTRNMEVRTFQHPHPHACTHIYVCRSRGELSSTRVASSYMHFSGLDVLHGNLPLSWE